jgi:hypothetical protein
MDNLLPHSRVIAYLSRYSLQPSTGARKFYVIVHQGSDSRDKLVKTASAFGCTGVIIIDETLQETTEQKDDERNLYCVASFEDARSLAREVLSSDIVGVLPTAQERGHRRSTSLNHPKAFSRTTSFYFAQLGVYDAIEPFCDRLIHISSNGSFVESNKIGVEACASIVFHHFIEMRLELRPQSLERSRGEIEPVRLV